MKIPRKKQGFPEVMNIIVFSVIFTLYIASFSLL